jgi:hypothetical protein
MSVKVPEGTIVKSKGEGNNTITPEGIMMLFLAVVFDLLQIFVYFPILGWVITMMTNVIAFFFFTAWSMIRSGGSKRGVRVGKAKKWAKRKKWIRPLAKVLNIIPLLDYVTTFVPLWTIVVYLELVYKS